MTFSSEGAAGYVEGVKEPKPVPMAWLDKPGPGYLRPADVLRDDLRELVMKDTLEKLPPWA